MNIAKFIGCHRSWDHINNKLKLINDQKQQIILFTSFCQQYYQKEPSVYKDYKNTWLLSSHPEKLSYNVPKAIAQSCIILQDHESNTHLVYCVYTTKNSFNLTSKETEFLQELANISDIFSITIFTNASHIKKIYALKTNNKLKVVGYDDLYDVEPCTIKAISNFSDKNKTKTPRDYQEKAIRSVISGFDKYSRGQLILPCGAGKTLVSLWIKNRLQSKHTLVLVPSLSLLRQMKKEWTINSSTYIPYLCVCSEKDIDNSANENKLHTYEISGKVTTDPDEIKNFLTNHNQSIIYSTYQSLEQISTALKGTGFRFDLAICDEAHKTSSIGSNSFSIVHDDINVPIKKRLYMTATPRVISNAIKNKLSKQTLIHDMSNHKIFGPEFHRMSFKEAIDASILVDYKIIAVGVTDKEVKNAFNNDKYTNDGDSIDEIAHNYALEKIMSEYKTKHALTFHSSVQKAKLFKSRHIKLYPGISSYHVNGKQSTHERVNLMKSFVDAKKSIITNARCLTEGVDVPAIDVVYFCDPKNSKVDIVQATGRALRKADHKNKTTGYIVVPIFHHIDSDIEDVIESGSFYTLISVVRSLSAHDERLVDEINRMKSNSEEQENKKDEIINYDENFTSIVYEGFTKKLQNSLINQIINKTRYQYRSFADARDLVHKLKLSNNKEWRDFTKSSAMPVDIPVAPETVYKDKGWAGYGDWLGNGNISYMYRKCRDFLEARKFVHSLGFKSRKQWTEYCKNNSLPPDIPASPRDVYLDNGWVSWGDWLGSGTQRSTDIEFLPFDQAKDYARQLNLKSETEWRRYIKSGKKPNNIPSAPWLVYKDKGWKNIKDWLGTDFLPYNEAQEFTNNLNFLSIKEWRLFAKSKNKPCNIPSTPQDVYLNNGWVSWEVWLGVDKIKGAQKTLLSFPKAKEYVHKLGFNRKSKWEKYCKNGEKPDFLPWAPDKVYRNQGWISWEDWLGAKIIVKKYLSYEEAKTYIRKQGLASGTEWRQHYKKNKPDFLPADPAYFYKNKGWVSWQNFLGYKNIKRPTKNFLPFEEARKYIRTFNIAGQKEWAKFAKTSAKPDNIPADPRRAYKDSGWISYSDWLGTGNISNLQKEFLSFNEAKKLVHKLKLNSKEDWVKYYKKHKPVNLPADPSRYYKNVGWVSWGHWVGTNNVANRNRTYPSYKDAKKIVHKLNVRTKSEWQKLCKSSKKPQGLPSCPRTVYLNKGWLSWGDWLGTN